MVDVHVGLHRSCNYVVSRKDAGGWYTSLCEMICPRNIRRNSWTNFTCQLPCEISGLRAGGTYNVMESGFNAAKSPDAGALFEQ